MGILEDPAWRAAIRRRLEIDLLLGVGYVPLKLTPAGGSGPSPATRWRQDRPSAVPAASGTASARPAPPARSGVRPEMVQAVTAEELQERMQALKALDENRVRVCRSCKLWETRTRTVFGQGHAAARLVFVGEGPGYEEDQQGLAFVGKAGQLLTRMIEAMGLSRDEVFICNVVKCRPPDNRTPAPDEIAACWPYLDEQLRIIRPEVIVALGKPAAQTLLRTQESIGRMRGHWFEYYTSGSPNVGPPTPLMPTYHPAYLLRSPAEKAKAWSDLKQVMARLGLPVPR